MKKVLLIAALIAATSSCKKQGTTLDEFTFSTQRTSSLCVQEVGISGAPTNDQYTITVSYRNPDNKKKILLLKVSNAVGVMIVDDVIKVTGQGTGSYTFSLTVDGPWTVAIIDPCNGAYVAGQYGL